MAFFIATFAHALVPLALAMGLLAALDRAAPRRDPRVVSPGLAVGIGLAGGLVAVLLAVTDTGEAAVGTVVDGTTLLVCVAVLVVLLLLRGPLVGGGLGGLRARLFEAASALLLASFGARGVFAVWLGSLDHEFTSTDVVNTELIVNCAAVVLAVGLLAALTTAVAHVARLAGGAATLGTLAAILVLEAVIGSADVLLGLLRLDLVGVTSWRVSYVATAQLASPWTVYAELAAVVALAALAFARRTRAPAPGGNRVGRRKTLARVLTERRWRSGLAAVVVVLLVTLSYQDLYASLPPSLSYAEPVEPDASGMVRVPIEQVKDGSLHRFAYVASDGHRVRFFLINRYDEEHVRIGVVFDACMICGDAGYIQDGNDIICIACNVQVFRPSIGKPGGCNPIPLDHMVDDGAIVIAASALDAGARYFSEVVEIEVTDPVTGETLINLEAPFRYDFRGRTYFFGTQESYDAFRDDPDAFVGDARARRWRVQGHTEPEA